jgi:hypothetical protein
VSEDQIPDAEEPASHPAGAAGVDGAGAAAVDGTVVVSPDTPDEPGPDALTVIAAAADVAAVVAASVAAAVVAGADPEVAGAPSPHPPLLDDPTYVAAVTDLLGVLAYAELVAFERLAYDARMAPTLEDKAALARLATTEFGHYQVLERHLDGLGVDAEKAMSPFVVPLEAFHAKTAPSDWAESLVKAYVGDGIAADFYREVAKLLDPLARSIVLEVLADTGHAEFAVERVRQAIESDPTIAGRLALWGRRIVGEALAQAQAVCAEREALVTLLIGGVPGAEADLGELMRTFNRITDSHMARMAALGLSA